MCCAMRQIYSQVDQVDEACVEICDERSEIQQIIDWAERPNLHIVNYDHAKHPNKKPNASSYIGAA